MKVAIMQPYFFPYIGYIQLINAVDEFILFDTVQFIRHGWIERNRLIQRDGKEFYVKVPLEKKSRNTLIKDTKINQSIEWKEQILAQLTHYKKKAPFYQSVVNLVNEALNIDTNSIVNLNNHSLLQICKYLDINTPIRVWSEMGIRIEEAKNPDEWALNICREIGAKEYINPFGGLDFFDRTKYLKQNIDIKFLESDDIIYKQFPNIEFKPWLSILDVLMFNSVDEVKLLLTRYNLT
jgi:hypothetical protein